MYKHVPLRRAFGWADLVVLSGIAGLLYGLIGFAREFTGHFQPEAAIDLSPDSLPRYAFFSLMRAVLAYMLSFGFTLVYGYVAAKSRRAERVMLPLLDILQSIPVLGFLPGLVLGLVALFPDSHLGVELACIIMIFTGQVWNMTFSFYASLRSVPSELHEVASLSRLSWFERLRRVELPFSAIGLAWNSLMSMAGGWFFLVICESFTLENRKFQLPGIGSYMSVAFERGDTRALLYGIVAMAALVIFVDFLVWRPVMAWVRKFQMDEMQEDVIEMPIVTSLLRESRLVRRAAYWFWRRSRGRALLRGANRSPVPAPVEPLAAEAAAEARSERLRVWAERGESVFRATSKLAAPVTVAICIWGGTRLWELVRTLGPEQWRGIFFSAGMTLLRVTGALVLGSIWTIPAGIVIGSRPRLTRLFQPIIQVLASFPAPMIYPAAVFVLEKAGLSPGWIAMVLMTVGVQWYLLFNVLAGAMGITRDLRDGLTMTGARRWTRWRALYLPAVFPALVTGWITAAGGAWNASIVTEYVMFGGRTLVAPGIGSMISKATAAADFPLLAGCLIVLVATVVGLNRFFWRRIYEIAETKFRFER